MGIKANIFYFQKQNLNLRASSSEILCFKLHKENIISCIINAPVNSYTMPLYKTTCSSESHSRVLLLSIYLDIDRISQQILSWNRLVNIASPREFSTWILPQVSKSEENKKDKYFCILLSEKYKFSQLCKFSQKRQKPFTFSNRIRNHFQQVL